MAFRAGDEIDNVGRVTRKRLFYRELLFSGRALKIPRGIEMLACSTPWAFAWTWFCWVFFFRYAEDDLLEVVIYLSLTGYHFGVFYCWSMFTPDENVFEGVVTEAEDGHPLLVSNSHFLFPFPITISKFVMFSTFQLFFPITTSFSSFQFPHQFRLFEQQGNS